MTSYPLDPPDERYAHRDTEEAARARAQAVARMTTPRLHRRRCLDCEGECDCVLSDPTEQ